MALYLRLKLIMTYLPQKHNRRSIRLKGYDYKQAGWYFVTICIQDKCCLFGKIIEGKMKLNDIGHMIHKNWVELTNRFLFIEHDEYIIMPNHLHGIALLQNGVGASLVDAQYAENTINNRAGTRPAPTNNGLSDIIGAFKSITTNEYINGVHNLNWPEFKKRLWQRNYYEHIIRDESELNRIQKYIIENPTKWKLDNNNPNKMGNK